MTSLYQRQRWRRAAATAAAAACFSLTRPTPPLSSFLLSCGCAQRRLLHSNLHAHSRSLYRHVRWLSQSQYSVSSRPARCYSSAYRAVPDCCHLSAAVLLCHLQSPSEEAESSYVQGIAQYEAKQHKLALLHLTDAAGKGHALAALRLGTMYLTGYGAPRDLPTAVSFFSEAARGGNVQAQLHLASMLHRGVGIPRDAELAAKWYKQAADSGSSRAAVQYAIMRLKGEGGSKDYAEALPWLERAAEGGDAEAQHLTAMLLSHRHPFSPARAIPTAACLHPAFAGVRFEPARALSLLQSAADSDHVSAMTALAEQLCSSQPPAYELALPLYKAASEQANLTAQSRLGFLLHHGVGCEPDRQRAVTLLSTAAEGGRVEAQLLLMVIASGRAQQEGGMLGRMRLKVEEVLKEYAAKAVETMDRQRDEWKEEERQRMASVREEPQRAVQWVKDYETQRGEPWMGDLHELLTMLPAEENKPQ